MTPEKWQEILGNIKDNFEYENEGKEHLEEEGGVDIEFIEFEGPLGKMRLEYIARPVVIDKKTKYSNRIGSETKVDYVYSPTEKTQALVVFKWDENNEEWVEVEAGKMNL